MALDGHQTTADGDTSDIWLVTTMADVKEVQLHGCEHNSHACARQMKNMLALITYQHNA